MSLHKLTAGDGYTYLTRQVAAHDATNRGYGTLGEYYTEKGEAPGVWMGRGLSTVPEFSISGPVSEAQMVALFGEGRHPDAERIEARLRAAGASEWTIDQASRLGAPYRVYEQANMFHRRAAGAFRDHNTAAGQPAGAPVPPDTRARIRTELAGTMFAETYGRPPADARELSGFLARISRQATTAVAGYDLTFSPVKSVSTLWAIAPRELAEKIEQAHHDAVTDTLTWLENHAAYTRRGRNGVAQVDVAGLIAAAFTHRDSRAGDPDLHTHVAVSNKVRTLDGRWLALDGRALYKNNVTASERYNTRLEALLTDRLGVTFDDRPADDPAKRPVREIVGIDGALPRRWSSRRVSIDARRAVLSAAFQADHGRPPTAQEAICLAQQATTQTRQAKHEPRSYAEQRATWRAEALAVLGGQTGLADYLAGAFTTSRRRRPVQQVTDRWVRQTAADVLSTVQASRAVWQAHHVRAEAERQARAAGIGLPGVDEAVDAVVNRALSPALSLPLDTTEPITDPAVLRRADGTSVYTVAGSALYTSTDIVAAEQMIVAAGGRYDGRTVPAETVDLALLESTANGVDLNPGQVQLVRELATTGARVQLALAPAGTGKTAAMSVLARAWAASGGHVVGLAPSAAAAAVLGSELGATTDTLAKLIWHLSSGTAGPDWIDKIGPNTLVVIDEAGMAGTTHLAHAVEHIVSRGGSVRLIGDDQQLAAVGAGGVLRDLAEIHGALTLSQVMRFTDPDTGAPNRAEGAASLALRAGDPAAIAYYTDNHRIHVGDQTTVTDTAYTAWNTDRLAGRDAIMLAPTRDLAAQLNARAQQDRLAARPAPPDRQVTLVDGSAASAGDAIITTKNNRHIPIGACDWVKNGDRWTIEDVHPSGAVDVRHRRTGRHITLPADYVATNVGLGYASTVHAAQGITADISHTVATGTESRQLLYVAMTRGRHGNHVYLSVAGDGDPHATITRDALLPPTAVDILTRVLAHDTAPTSAASQTRALVDPAARLAGAADRYHDALATAAEQRLGPVALAGIDTAAEAAHPGLTGQPAYPTLRAHLALAAIDGENPADLLRTVLSHRRGLADAIDVAAVLDWRLDPTSRTTGTVGPLPWLPAVPDTLAADPDWGDYLRGRADHVSSLAGDLETRAGGWTPTSAPAWAARLLDRDPQLVAALAVWRATQQVPDTDRRPTGPSLPAAADVRAQRALDQRVATLLGDPAAATQQWKPLADGIDKRIPADPYWPVLADRLAAAVRAGLDITALTRTVAAPAPLPDEQPAAALWWRLSAHLTPAAMTATDQSHADTLRPNWTPVLTELFGAATAERVLTDPAWPALVAAVTQAATQGWQPGPLLTAAAELLLAGQPGNTPLRPEELATALVWRIAMLTDLPPVDDEPPEPPAPHEPADVDGAEGEDPPLATPDFIADDDWLASLVEPEYDDLPSPSTSKPGAWPDIDPVLAAWASPGGPEPSDDELFATVDEERKWATAVVSRERILQLNAQAAEFFTAHYTHSWAAGYLADRLGTDLAADTRFSVGYAPNSWTALTSHLRRLGASDTEIVGAGLGTHASTGRVVDRFRDRLMFPITSGPEIHGFIGRRDPTKTDTDKAGPKYLNTPQTDLFTKGHEMYGLAESAEALAAGATPVFVEGPIDAIAVTHAGDGQHVGLAPLGTAFTDAQADTLSPYLGHGRPGAIVATDNDRAGQQAAHRAYWQLTALGDNPRQLIVPAGMDPAGLLETGGPAALRQALETPTSLADTLIQARLAHLAGQLHTPAGRTEATRQAADVIGALPPQTWPQHIPAIAARIGISSPALGMAVFEAGQDWTDNPRALARTRIADRLPDMPVAAPARSTSAATSRWAGLAASIDPQLTTDPGWAALARSLDRAATSGYDVPTALPALAAQDPLPGRHTARTLEYRLIDACPAAAHTPGPHISKTAGDQAEAAAVARLTAAEHGTLPQGITGGTRRAPSARKDAPQARRDTDHARL